ncbi:MAG: hypothetical protein KQH63_05320 [Desulfobulbaceae bacterium]|nr:hypothetical protein [Desulfobulbaceae bacterium]
MNKKPKFCECCGIKLSRKRYGNRLESTTAFKKRRFCTISCANTRKQKTKEAKQEQAKKIHSVPNSIEAENLAPLTYMLKVMNDPNEPDDRRDRMAIAAAKYVHCRAKGTRGKKDDLQEAAKKASTGRFSAGKPPKVVDIKGRFSES